MGAKQQRRAYGELDKTWVGTHQNYFKAQSSGAVILAFVEPPEVEGPGSQYQVVIVTSGGIAVFSWKTGKELRTLHMEIDTAAVGTSLNGTKTMAYVGSGNIVFIAEPSTAEAQRQETFNHKVTALKVIPGAWVVVGMETGEISMVKLDASEVRFEVSSDYFHPVKSLASAGDMVVAGYTFVPPEPRTKLVLFHTTDQGQSSHLYEWLAGSCADLSLLETEGLILALAESSLRIDIWDVNNQNYLIGVNISPSALNCFLGLENGQGLVTLILGGGDVTLGELSVGEESMSWTPKRKSTLEGKAKVKPGLVTSLQVEKTLGLLVYGDSQGQAWLVDFVPTTQTTQRASLT